MGRPIPIPIRIQALHDGQRERPVVPPELTLQGDEVHPEVVGVEEPESKPGRKSPRKTSTQTHNSDAIDLQSADIKSTVLLL